MPVFRERPYTAFNFLVSMEGFDASIRIELLAEDRSSVVQSWRLRNAVPVAIHGPVLQAMGNDVAVERLVLMGESLEIE